MKKLLFIAIVLTACQSENDHWKIDLPVHLNSNQRESFSKLLPDSVRQKDLTRAFLFESGNATAFLAIDGFFLTLQTLDKDNVQIDTVHLIKGFGDEDHISDVTINPDKTIVKIDSTFANILADPENVDHIVRAVAIDTIKYRVTDGGKIERVDE